MESYEVIQAQVRLTSYLVLVCVNCAELHYDNSTHTRTTWGSNLHLLYVPLAHPLLFHNPDDPLVVSMPQPGHYR